MIEVARLKIACFQAVTNRFGRKAGPMLDPIKALFFNSGNQLTLTEQRSRCIAVIGIDAKNRDHLKST